MSRVRSDVHCESTGADLEPLDGFPSLAAFIASDNDHTSLVFRRFDLLAARNLLYLQSELAEMEAQLETFDAEDHKVEDGSLDMKCCAMKWEKFRDMSATGNEEATKRMDLILAIRKKLKEYSKFRNS
jgi:hypothetical protein